MTGKRSLLVNQRRAAGIAAWASDLRLVRGSCLARIRRVRCRSRYGIVRLSVDFRSRAERDILAVVECARCGHVWYRTRPPKLGEYQSVRLTLILPGDQHRWFARGRWHSEGSDGIVIDDATWPDLMAAGEEWRKRHDQYADALTRKAAKKTATDAAANRKAAALIATWNARKAAEQAAEQAAALREA